MGFNILNQTIRLSVKLTPAERLVTMALANDITDSSATGTVSVDYLAGVCDLRVRTVQKALLRLEELGLLSRLPGQGRVVGPKRQRTTLYVWHTEVALRGALSDKALLRRGMASRRPSDQRRRYGCLVSEMDDASTPSVLSDPRPDEGEADEPSSSAPAPESVSEPAGVDLFSASPVSPSAASPAGFEPEAPARVSSSGKGLPSHPEWRRYAAAFEALGKGLNRFSAQAWLRFVQQDGPSPKAVDARAALAADRAEQYVKDLRADRQGFAAAKKYAKSAANFLAEGEWEKHPPRPEEPQPAQGEPLVEDWGSASVSEESFEDRYSEYARAAVGDEGAIRDLRKMLPARCFEAPDGVPARWPGLIDLLGLREPLFAVPEDHEAFALHSRAGECEVGERPVGAPEGPSEAGSGGCGGGVASWLVAPVGTPSEAYTEACARPWEPRLAPPAPEPEASPDEPVAAVGDDEWGIAEGERAARSARYSAAGSAEEFREQALLAAQGSLWSEGD